MQAEYNYTERPARQSNHVRVGRRHRIIDEICVTEGPKVGEQFKRNCARWSRAFVVGEKRVVENHSLHLPSAIKTITRASASEKEETGFTTEKYQASCYIFRAGWISLPCALGSIAVWTNHTPPTPLPRLLYLWLLLVLHERSETKSSGDGGNSHSPPCPRDLLVIDTNGHVPRQVAQSIE